MRRAAEGVCLDQIPVVDSTLDNRRSGLFQSAPNGEVRIARPGWNRAQSTNHLRHRGRTREQIVPIKPPGQRLGQRDSHSGMLEPAQPIGQGVREPIRLRERSGGRHRARPGSRAVVERSGCGYSCGAVTRLRHDETCEC